MFSIRIILFLAPLLMAVLAGPRKPASYYFDVCHTSDPNFNECVKRLLVKMKPQFVKGIASLNLLPLEPLQIPKIEMREGSGNFRLYQKLTDLKIYGMSNYTIKDFNFDYQKKELNNTLYFPQLKLVGNYEVDGQILVLPIKGNGKVTYICSNVTIRGESKMETFEKDKVKYVRIKDYKLRIDPGHAFVNFTNLFNGDKALGDATNKFLNDNWRDAFYTYRDLPETAFSEYLKVTLNNVYTSFPEKELFPE